MKKTRQRAGIDRGIRLIMLAKWRQAFELLRAVPGPPSAFKQLRELTERMHAGTDIEEAQQRHGYASEHALKKWLRRNR